MSGTDERPVQHKPSWLILIVLAAAQFMLIVDVTIVNIALPSIQRSFGLSDANLQWIVTAYALTFGGFLLLGGRSADYFGRRRTFLAGLGVFTLASLGSGLARSGADLVAFRAIQGLAGAFMSPAALSMVLVTYPEGAMRNIALAVWGAIASAGGALGVLLGGIFTQYLGWQWNFFINVPIGVIVFFATMSLVHKHGSVGPRKGIDILGAILVTGALMSLVYGLVKAPTYGWGDQRTLVIFATGIAALIIFVFNETLVRHPLVPMSTFRVRNIAGADVVMLTTSASVFSSLFFMTLYVQDLLGYSPVKTGMSFLIFPAFVAMAATSVPRFVRRIGYKPLLVAGPMLMAAGLFYESGIPVFGSYWKYVVPGMALMALGMGTTIVSSTIAATSGIRRADSGLASGLLTTSQQLGGSIGLAAVTALVTSSTARFMANFQSLGQPTKELVAAATVHGFQEGLLLAGCFALVAAGLAAVLVRSGVPEQVKAQELQAGKAIQPVSSRTDT